METSKTHDDLISSLFKKLKANNLCDNKITKDEIERFIKFLIDSK